MAELVAITAIGVDRPGIVAGVTRVLYDVGCNLEDVSSTILRGHFSMVLVVRCPEGVDHAHLESALAPVADDLGLVITARPVEETTVEVEAPSHMVSVYGGDRPGIVYRVADALSSKGINITDLTSRMIGSEDRPVYALMLEVSAGDGTDLTEELSPLARELGVEVSVHPIDADLL